MLLILDKESYCSSKNRKNDRSQLFKRKWRITSLIYLYSDANKTVFDWCKEGNVKKLDLLLTRGEDINAQDDQVIKKKTFVNSLLIVSFDFYS